MTTPNARKGRPVGHPGGLSTKSRPTTSNSSVDPEPVIPRTFTNGAAFILDIPKHVPAIWGRGNEVLWAKGESLMICGSPGTGKTTVTGQLVRASIIGGDDVLGYPVHAQGGKVLYLAMDRPSQIARSLARQFAPEDREALAAGLVVHQGPPPADLAVNPHVLRDMALAVGASMLVVDSLKDAALRLSEDATGAGYNRARQMALAAGIQLLELHHQVKRGNNGADPTTLADVYGSTWLTSGAGSVILLAGNPGDQIVELRHLKPVVDKVGPFKVAHDPDTGRSAVWNHADPVAMAAAAGPAGITVKDYAMALYSTERPTASQIAAASRKLKQAVKEGSLHEIDRPTVTRGGTPAKAYIRPAESSHESSHGPLTHPALEDHSRSSHADSRKTVKTTRTSLTGAVAATHAPNPVTFSSPFKGENVSEGPRATSPQGGEHR